MKAHLLAAALLVAMAVPAAAQSDAKPVKPPPWTSYNRGIKWETSLDLALKKAAETGKPVLLHQLVGDMKAEGC